MAALSSGKQGVGVYLVCPLPSAAFAASLMNAGVSKSGSPAPNPTTSMPAFFMALALALTARVIDSETRFIRSARGNILGSLLLRAGNASVERGGFQAEGKRGDDGADRARTGNPHVANVVLSQLSYGPE